MYFGHCTYIRSSFIKTNNSRLIHIGFTHMEHKERKRVILIIVHISHFLYCTWFSSLMETGMNITFRKKKKNK